MAIRILKLSNGENVVAEIVESNGGYRLRKALKVVEHYNKKKGEHNILLIRWMPYTDDIELDVSENQIIVMVTPTAGLEEHYIQRAEDVFGFEDDFELTEEDILLLQDFQDAIEELPDDDDIIH